MDRETCQGCVRARDDGGFAVPGSTACLGCRRAIPHAAEAGDLWTAGPPGGTVVEWDDCGLSFALPFPPSIRRGVAALAGALCATGALAGQLPATSAAVVLLASVALGGLGRRCALRHTWSFQGRWVRHVIRAGPLRVTRQYPADRIRAFHCAGRRANGCVRFHCGPHTFAVADLAPPADNEWLMRRLNDRLAAGRAAFRRA